MSGTVRRGAFVLTALLAVACSSDTRSDIAGSASSAASAESGVCAWSVRADKATLNIAYPDTAATYWAISYALAPGEHLELAGRFPDARYMSFVTYGPVGGAIDVVTDVDVQPDAGSTNPFRAAGASADSSGDRRYTVTIEPDAPVGDHDNRLAAAAGADATTSTTTSLPATPPRVVLGSRGPDAAAGTVLYRVYLPKNAADPMGGAGLPDVRLVASGRATAIPTCADPGPSQTAIDIVNNFDRPVQEPPATPTFIRPEQRTVNLFPNPDNVYVATTATHQPGRIVVVRGRAPTFPDTRHGASVTGDEQVRFWSMCTNELRKPYPVTACAADDETKLDGDGFFTYVIATRADRPAETSATADSAWLDWGATDVPVLLLLRHMLASPSFAESATHVEPGALSAPTMKEYSPRGAYCDKAVFEQGGYRACGL